MSKGILTKSNIKNILQDLFYKSEVNFFNFTHGSLVSYNNKDYVTVGMLLKKESIKFINNDKFLVNIMLGEEVKDENTGKVTIEPAEQFEVELSLGRLLSIDKTECKGSVTHLELEIVLMFNQLYCLARLNSLKQRYLELEPVIF